jgi:esterase/lipase superfamily enzyme
VSAKIKASSVKTAVIFIHGYNTTFDAALYSFAQIIYDGQLNNFVPVLFSWPSQGDLSAYLYDADNAQNSVSTFETLVKFLQTECGIDNINIIAHSMGNRIVVDALADLSAHEEIKPLEELIMAAPDVNRETFISKANLIQRASKGVTLYASSSDRALGISGFLAEMPRLGKVESDGPVTIDGIDAIDVTAMGDELLSWNHNTYANGPLVDDISRLIRFETRPPGTRSPRIRGVPEGSNHPRYWRFAE